MSKRSIKSVAAWVAVPGSISAKCSRSFYS
jgi:hypothetical protein